MLPGAGFWVLSHKQKARAGGPGFFWNGNAYSAKLNTGFSNTIRAKVLDQAAGLNSLVALALIGSTVSVATRWLNSASSFVLAVKVSNCLRACAVHSSSTSEGDFTPNSECAKSRFAVVEALNISISLAEYSDAPLLAVVNTASMVPLWLSATSLNLA